MRNVAAGAPLTERGGRLRGVVDLAAGHYPKFLFGLGIGQLLPVFHFHGTTPGALEPAFRYLAENGYRTVLSDEAARFVREGRHPGPKTVMLAFDDAWASLWMVVGPLLERYDLRAVTYAIPGRTRDAAALRQTLKDGPIDAEAADRSDTPFATWPELLALSNSGRVDVQSHTFSHAMIFTDRNLLGVVDPRFAEEPWILYPRINAHGAATFLKPTQYGHPIFGRRSRMSDGRRFWPDPARVEQAQTLVREQGGVRFFDRPDWRAVLAPLVEQMPGRTETEADQREEIEAEIVLGRDELQTRLGRPVRHMCLPWGVTGRVTRAALERLGFVSAFANRMAGRMAVAAGDDPFYLKRLDNRHIFALPGKGRRAFTTLL